MTNILKPEAKPKLSHDDIKTQVCDFLATGLTLIDICDMEGFPNRVTINRWMKDEPEFAARIGRAREDQQDYFADRIQQLNLGMNAKNWQYTNAQIRNIQWLMGKLKPKVYGDKVQQEHTGAEGGPVQFMVKSILDKG
jgi:hypothetical protein